MTERDFGVFKILYAFHHPTYVLAEIKRTDLDDSYKPDERFFWFLFNKKSQSLERLKFISMDKKEGQDLRTFEEGRLWFSQIQASFTDNSDKEIRFLTLAPKNLSIDFEIQVTKFFR